ncbi:MAG TPA: hypothetical protein VFN31_00470 [Candidatus Saccharimonadales bacterium]|nr:hypothetical protein [Candidatus Saccharimonadales bacterium]
MYKVRFLIITLGLLIAGISFSSAPTFAISPNKSVLQTLTSGQAPDILIQPVQGPSVTKQLESRAKTTWPWYLTRAAGMVAAVSLVLLMLSGIGFITGASFKFLEPLTAWATHKAIAYVFAVSLAIHGIALVFDKFVPFSVAQILVPFLSSYRRISIAGHYVGSLYVALGVFALYFVIAIIISSILWIDKKPHSWKALHFLAYLTMIFVFFHALYLGTDLSHGILRVIWIILGISVAIAILYRLRRLGRA